MLKQSTNQIKSTNQNNQPIKLNQIKSTTLFLKIITNFSKIDENLGKNSGKCE